MRHACLGEHHAVTYLECAIAGFLKKRRCGREDNLVHQMILQMGLDDEICLCRVRDPD